MDYEKMYKAVLKTATQWIKDGCSDKVVKMCLECIFPELRESEDERIRKFLLDYAIEMIAGLESDISLSTYDGIKGHDPDAEAELNQTDEDIITIHMGRVVSDELYDQIVKDIVKFLERKYPSDANWYLEN